MPKCFQCSKRYPTWAEASLCFITDSPPKPHGGFHKQTRATASAALRLIARYRGDAKRLRLKAAK